MATSSSCSTKAYYALWAKHLAWGYFDHPPMVALWIRLSTILFGEHEFGVRALGTLSATAGTGIIYLLSWHLFADRQAAIFASLLYCVMLLISAGAIIITRDTPLLFFWSIALYALVRILGGGSSAWWWIVGVSMGLALQSKYTAVLLGAGIVCALFLVPRLHRWWRHPMPYVAGALALAQFAPVIVWNYQHAWASFAFQFGRAHIDSLNPLFILELLGSQIGLLTPFVFVLAVGGLWLGLRARRRRWRSTHVPRLADRAAVGLLPVS
jgi:4-amino-4-deoxy-L-arabinose transferase-like glycosyltransferase